MDNQIIAKILSGQASEQETSSFFSYCELHPEWKDEYIRLKNLWVLSISEVSPNKKKSFENFWRQTRKSRSIPMRRIFFELSKYAAVIVFTLGLAYLVNSELNTGKGDLVQVFASEIGSVSSIKLSDGSKIWLNSGSELTFTEKSKNRIVARLSGEAFFEIEHNPNREFLIDAGEIRIRDLGTKFNVKAYEQDNEITATLIEGEIDIQSRKGITMQEMSPNDHFSMNKSSRKYLLKKIDSSLVAGWKDGKFVFIDMNLRQICDELEKWYDVEIVFENKKLEADQYSSVLKRTTTIQQMMEMLKLSANINYEIRTNKNGTDEVRIK
ncbi:FecR family protein [Sunxiuqinia sp. sy24]|uniref:FecR family protein n=1 Tax=Sunxiuqinia sp. sy24 TaxID=3461495 RepID=UPI004045325C